MHRRSKWLKGLKRFDLLEASDALLFRMKVCGDHFEDTMFSNSANRETSSLKKAALPTLMLHLLLENNVPSAPLPSSSSTSNLDPANVINPNAEFFELATEATSNEEQVRKKSKEL